MDFRQNISAQDFSMYDSTNYDKEYYLDMGYVDWELYIEAKTWGVKSINVYVNNFYFEIDDDGKTIKMDKLTAKQLGYEIEIEGIEEYEFGNVITITDININETDKLIQITFN